MRNILLAAILCSSFTEAFATSPAAIMRVGGDLQIAIGFQSLAKPFIARVVDATGSPLQGIGTIIGPMTSGTVGPGIKDEFGFRGFNVTSGDVDYLAFNFPPPQYSLSDALGLSSGTADSPNSPPSAYLIGAVVLDGTRNSTTVPPIFYSVIRTVTTPVGKPEVAVEYFNSKALHYFVTANPAEMGILDSGTVDGWSRSVGSLAVYRVENEAAPGVVPVCRFFSAKYTSHFYTADQHECDAVINKWPETWLLETRSAFFVMLPDNSTGQCPTNFQPVFRLYTTRNGPNHRYVTDAKLRDTMVVAGWTAEGVGVDSTVFCTNR